MTISLCHMHIEEHRNYNEYPEILSSNVKILQTKVLISFNVFISVFAYVRYLCMSVCFSVFLLILMNFSCIHCTFLFWCMPSVGLWGYHSSGRFQALTSPTTCITSANSANASMQTCNTISVFFFTSANIYYVIVQTVQKYQCKHILPANSVC